MLGFSHVCSGLDYVRFSYRFARNSPVGKWMPERSGMIFQTSGSGFLIRLSVHPETQTWISLVPHLSFDCTTGLIETLPILLP
jgi:hypothetical protein